MRRERRLRGRRGDTDVDGTAALPAIDPSVNDLTVSASVSPARLPDTGGTVTYQVPVAGTAGAVLDAFTATVPAGASLVPGSVRWQGSTVPDGVATAGTIVFQGPFTKTGTGDTLTFALELPAVSGNRTTSVVGTVGSATIDTTLTLTDEAPATGTVNVNTFPVATPDAVTVDADRTSVTGVLGNDTDADSDPLTVTAAGPAGHGTVSVVAGVVSYTPDSGFTGGDTFPYTVSDGRGGTSTSSVTITVSAPPVVEPPVVEPPVVEPPVVEPPVVEPPVVEPPVVEPPVVEPPVVEPPVEQPPVVEPPVEQPPVEQPPVVQPPAALVLGADQISTASGTGATISPLGNDTGDGPLGVRSAGGAAHGTVTVTGDDVTYQPEADYWGPDSFTYVAADMHGATETGTVTVSVLPAPAPVADAVTVEYRTGTLIDVLANDPPGATVTTVTAPAHGTVTRVGGSVRYVPASGFAGTDSFTCRLTGQPSYATVYVTVAAPALRAADDAVTVVRGTAGRIDVLANDHGTRLVVAGVSGAARGSAELRDDGVWYTSAEAFRGTDSFTYTVLDEAGRTANATVRVTVPNAGPVVAAVTSRTVTAGGTLVVPFGVDDPNGDELTLTAGEPAGTDGAGARIRRTVSGNRLTLAVDERFSGVVTIPVTVRDDEASAATELHVTVLPAPAASAVGAVLPDPGARAELANPVYVDGRPTSRTLSDRVDSVVTWRSAPATNLLGYRVTLNGTRVCTPRPVAGPVQSCRINGTALGPGDAVRVVAVGANGTLSEPIAARIAPASSASRLLAVVYFPVADFALDAAARRVLATVALQARTYGFGTALMEGHTDADGTAASNVTLSQRRAAQVAAYFRRAYPGLRATHNGRGESRPVRPNATDRGKAVNRRVEIYIG
ncbi:Ig-like domain-containing protein [Pseudosporangium ferrugineum]|uniref:Ig-like domain-containing protein n=1 Tax=Pseudosporangium ferrugineum TaxID=439699 RepID=UPI000D078BC1|nr:Ig-like domain-containing protein [Pseudosporangium ferrugineum]